MLIRLSKFLKLAQFALDIISLLVFHCYQQKIKCLSKHDFPDLNNYDHVNNWFEIHTLLVMALLNSLIYLLNLKQTWKFTTQFIRNILCILKTLPKTTKSSWHSPLKTLIKHLKWPQFFKNHIYKKNFQRSVFCHISRTIYVYYIIISCAQDQKAEPKTQHGSHCGHLY